MAWFVVSVQLEVLVLVQKTSASLAHHEMFGIFFAIQHIGIFSLAHEWRLDFYGLTRHVFSHSVSVAPLALTATFP